MSLIVVGYIAIVAMLALILLGVPIAWSMAIVGVLGELYVTGFTAAASKLSLTLWENGTLFVFIALPLFLLMGLPVAVAIGLSCLATFWTEGFPLELALQNMISGMNVFSFLATVANGTTAGNKTLPATITDAQMRTGSGSVPLFVEATLHRIWEIQGSSPATPPCNVPACLSRSAFAGQLITLQGIVTARKSNGFFVQEPDPGDSDPSTSDGIFIFTSSTPPAAAAVGAMVKVSGTVQEFSPSSDPNSPPQTEISGTPTVSQVSTGNPLPAGSINLIRTWIDEGAGNN